MAKKYVGANSLYLAGSGSIVGATSITLTTFTDIYGDTLTMSDFGDLGYITFEPDTTNQEFATFTGVTANANTTFTLTGVKTALAKSPYTQTSGLTRSHSGGTKVVISDSPAFWDTFANKNNDETISGKYTFPNGANRLVLDSDTDTANPAAVVTFGQLSRQAVAGAADASTVVKGITKISVAPVSAASPISVGDNDPRVPTQAENDALVGNNTDVPVGSGNKMVTQTGLQHNTEKYAVDSSASSTAYVVALSPAPTSLTDGMTLYAKIVNSNTTTTPTLNLNGLGAKTIVKGSNNSLNPGDILANQLCQFVYDATNTVWVLQGIPSSSKLYSTTTNVTVNNTATETTILTTSIPGNTLSTSNVVRGRIFFSFTNGDTALKTIRMKYGATTVASADFTASSATGTVFSGYIDFLLMGAGTTSSQEGSFSFIAAPNNMTATAGSVFLMSNAGDGTASEVSTGALNLVFTWQSAAANNTPFVLKQAVIETIK